MEKVVSLHRYWLQADSLRLLFQHEGASAFEHLESAKGHAFAEALIYLSPVSVLMSFWYASLYVVVEGYRELGLSDPNIDALLTSPHLKRLHRFRNGVCHYQPAWFPEKIGELHADEEHVDWVHLLHRRLGAFLLEKLKSTVPERRRTEIEEFIADTRQITRDERPNQPPQRNAGSRPSSDDSSASETPSSLGPRG